ncbi:MAG: hypothetical protein M1357_00310 [Candidatus Marsarchaeota archaeon]|nr:hypothetical protein [Candidatus Marsarchaeota archaeon]
MSRESGVRPCSISHRTLQKVVVEELIREGFSKDAIRVEAALGSKTTDVCASSEDKELTVVECKTFKHTNDYAMKHMHQEGVKKTVICQPFFDVDELWLVYKDDSNHYKVMKVQHP